MRISDWSSDVCSSDLSTIQVEASPLLVAGAGLFSAAGDAASAFFGAAPLSSALVAADLSALLSPPCSPARFFLPPDLKSVSYQPPPLRRKPAAETCLISFGLPHSGQTVSGGSEILCRISLSAPQAVQW